MLDWEELDAAGKEAIRLLSEADYLTFLRLWFQLQQGEKWRVNWHHRLIAHEITQMVVHDERSNLVINVPPGSGKTENLSIHAPAWMVLKCRKFRNLNISFSNALTARNSKRTRDLIASPEWQSLWPSEFGTNQAEEWQLIDRRKKPIAEVVSRSAGGQITGGRGGYVGPGFSGWVLLDDFDKPDDMFSEVKRTRNHQLLTNTVRSRRGDKSRDNPTPVVAIQQRLHALDSSAFMLAGKMGLKFRHVKVPALVTMEYLDSLPEWLQPYAWADVMTEPPVVINGVKYWSFCPSTESAEDLADLWQSDPYTFASQYQQEPETLSGGIFREDDFLYYGDQANGADVPDPAFYEYRIITADTAQKTEERHDFTVFNEWGVSAGNLYKLRTLRGKWEADRLRGHFLSFVRAAWADNGPIKGNLRAVYVEDKSSGTGLIQEASSQLPIKPTAVQRSRDKLTRAMDAQPHHKAGKVRLRYGDPDNVSFVAEVCDFKADDTHKHDDQTDTMLDAIDQVCIQPATRRRVGVL